MSQSPRVSFVMPAYNAERWISKAIWSCRNQTIKQIEVIVVNDASQDDTGDIIDWHAKEDKRVRHVFQGVNGGRSHARNVGNDCARAPFILVLDADDMAARNRAKDTLAAFELKKADLLYGSFFLMDSMGTVDRKIICGAFSPELSKEKKLNFICHSTMAYRKDLAQDVRYDEGEFSRLGLDDWKFQWEAYRKGYSIKHLRKPLCYYRATQDGISQARKPEEVEKIKDLYLATI